MNIFDFLRSRKKETTASIAKERLQIIVAHERGQRSQPDYLPALQQELVAFFDVGPHAIELVQPGFSGL